MCTHAHTQYKSPDDVAITQPTTHQNYYTQETTVRVEEAEEIEKPRGKRKEERKKVKEKNHGEREKRKKTV